MYIPNTPYINSTLMITIMIINNFTSLILYSIFHNIIVTIVISKINNENLNNTIKLSYIISSCVVIPFLEESIFRSCLFNLLSDVPNYKIIISALFGLLHTSNAFIIFKQISTFSKTLIGISQCFMTFLLGQYLNTLTLGYAIITHMTFNFVITMWYNLSNYYKLRHTQTQTQIQEIGDNIRFIDLPEMKRCLSMNSIDYLKKKGLNFRNINISNFPEDIKKIIKAELHRNKIIKIF